MALTATASPRRKRCICCRHPGKHCTCVLDKKPRKRIGPVTVKPDPCQIRNWLCLSELAFAIGVAIGVKLTVWQISGAIRALNIRGDTTPTTAVVKGTALFRQQTMVHPKHVTNIQAHIQSHI